ncbi:M56 family metallopeptidase [Gilvimarinus sp. DA14]|uniref:M56 family metallopeptidase n=1 Tax=Gilvimarinus sp. DA14 TaxID=2956798 RepID=UPI0020B66647|nr:M56 family metallopeptidase [Gilvimarinus sp. DA14]UTF60663.1 M56 family metallopeptidase [Gilvimarinus sp. DA14]
MSSLLAPVSQWLLLWVLALLVLRMVYSALRQPLMRLHPSDAATIQLALYAVPVVLSGALVWAVNGGAGGLLLSHCHGDICSQHRPDIQYPLLLLILGAGLLSALLLWALWHWQRDRRRARQLLQLAERQGDWWILPTQAPTAFTLGFWHCKLVASQGLLAALSPDALQVIAAHEQAHKRRGDNLRNVLARLALLPALPVCRQLLADLDLNHEKACDRAACQRNSPTLVAQTIIDVTRLQQSATDTPSASFFARSHVSARVQALLAPVPQRAHSGIIMCLIWLFAAMGFTLGLDPLHHLLEWLW